MANPARYWATQCPRLLLLRAHPTAPFSTSAPSNLPRKSDGPSGPPARKGPKKNEEGDENQVKKRPVYTLNEWKSQYSEYDHTVRVTPGPQQPGPDGKPGKYPKYFRGDMRAKNINPLLGIQDLSAWDPVLDPIPQHVSRMTPFDLVPKSSPLAASPSSLLPPMPKVDPPPITRFSHIPERRNNPRKQDREMMEEEWKQFAFPMGGGMSITNTHFGETKTFSPEKPEGQAASTDEGEKAGPGGVSSRDVNALSILTGFAPNYITSLQVYQPISKVVMHQTGKGRVKNAYCLCIVGDGNGMVGYGEGKSTVGEEGAAAGGGETGFAEARRKAWWMGVRSLDWVERKDGRTVWGEREEKLGTTRIVLRQRPPGFGLRCNRTVHWIAKAAGISDLGAKIWGSKNPMKIIKTTVGMLWAAPAAPYGMHEPLPSTTTRIHKLTPMRTAHEIARARGRIAVDESVKMRRLA